MLLHIPGGRLNGTIKRRLNGTKEEEKRKKEEKKEEEEKEGRKGVRTILRRNKGVRTILEQSGSPDH